ncbi:MAG: geranylgeranyl reductase family protein [Acidimicrobiia bacterium]
MLATDVLVVGGGPAGSAAAITLARAGRDVMLVDKAAFPRDKCCGDGLTTASLRLLEELGFSPKSTQSWQPIDAAWVRSPSGREVRFPMPAAARGEFAAVVPRLELDAALLDVARDAGVEVHDGHGVTAIDTSPLDGTVVSIDGADDVHARYVVAADGMWSPVRRMVNAGEDRYLGEWHAFRQYASNVTGNGAHRLWVWFEDDLLPGYAWSFPLPGGRVNIGFGVLRDQKWNGHDMKKVWPDLLARPHVREALGPNPVFEGSLKAWPIPARVDRSVLHRGRVLFVGDAAAATDALTGEGIGQALLTGKLAAEAILGGGAIHPEITGARYDRAVHDEFAADHRMSMVLSRVLHSSLAARGAVRVAGATDWTRRNFGRWLFEDEPRAIIATPRRWHRNFLDRDGAFS